jgi:uncharacterized protein
MPDASPFVVPTLRDDLARPDAYPDAPSSVDVVETHISWVFLTRDAAYKVKKPVDFGFLDFRSLESRRRACEAELALNTRLTEGVYRGLVPVRQRPDGHFALGEGEGEIVDWAVHMKRLPDERRADLMLLAGELGLPEVDLLAMRVAAFHASCKVDERAVRHGVPDAIAASVEENFSQVGDALERYVSRAEASELRRLPRALLASRRPMFERRVKTGRVRDGHGDLRLEHVYFTGAAPQILDCIEFNERFRYGDVCADVAFLSMDLAHFGAVDLAERFLAQYARASNDYDIYELVDFYEGYRAFVRGKVAHFVARDGALPLPTRQAAEAQARGYFLLALSTERRALLSPQVVCIGGIIAAGKSTLADALACEMSAPVVDADRTRKDMVGVQATQAVKDDAWSGAYDPAFTERVYEEVLRRARVVLASRRPVILDASFRSPRFRAAARALAREMGAPFCFLECQAPMDVIRARLTERARGASVSDGRLEVLDDFVKRYEPVTELSEAEHLVVDTSTDLEHQLSRVRARVSTWPRGLVA